MRAVAMRAIQAPPMLCACTISTCSEAIRRSRVRALRLSLNGLNVAFTSGAHSPPKAVSSPTSGPSSAATSARAPDCTSAEATLSAVRATGSSRKAGRICRTVAFAKVCGGAWLSSLCTEANSLDPHRLVCRSGILVFNGGARRNTPAASVRPKPGSPNERSLPEILECWNRYCGPQDCRSSARGRGTRPVLGGRFQIGHEGHQGRGARSVGAGPRPGYYALRLFRPRRIRRQFHRRHDRPLVRGNARRVRCLLPRTAGCDRLVDGRVAGAAADARADAPNAARPERGAPRADRAGGRLHRRADVEWVFAGGQARDRANRRLGATVAIFRATLSDHPRAHRGGTQTPAARWYDRDRLPGADPPGRAGSRRALAAHGRADRSLCPRRRRAHAGEGRRSSPVTPRGHRTADCRRGRGVKCPPPSAVLGATVGGNLHAIGHAVVPDHAGNPQSIVGEYFRAAQRLRAAMRFEVSPCAHRRFVAEE